MIYHLKGEITERENGFVVIDVGGVGYKVFVSSETAERVKSKDTLFCFMHLTGKELKLYGFKEKENLSFFEDLIKISGIGPKSALQLASIAPMEELKKAIEREDRVIMKKIMKVGRKKGERVVFELSRRYIKMKKDEAFEVLKGLGFEEKDIEDALEKVSEEINKEERVKEALKLLDRRR